MQGLQTWPAGTEPGARNKVAAGHIGSADLVFVMEKKQLRRLWENFAEAMVAKRVICLNISDDFTFMQPELVALLESAVPPYLQE